MPTGSPALHRRTDDLSKAGVGLKGRPKMACELDLSGLEFACAPGSVGGACFRAGATAASLTCSNPSVLLAGGTLRWTHPSLTWVIVTAESLMRAPVLLSATFNLHRTDAKIREKDGKVHAREESSHLSCLPLVQL